jgi:hypothetical protein
MVCLALATAAARPMPVKAPVIKTTRLFICHPRNLLPYRQSMEVALWPRLGDRDQSQMLSEGRVHSSFGRL